MTYLAGTELTAAAKKGTLIVRRGDEICENYDSWDIALHMGPEAFVSTDEDKRLLKPSQSLTIHPGEFGLLLTEEWLQIPDDAVGFISVKFDLKQRGLSNISGFHVDPGYKGRLLFSVYNAGSKPIMLQRGQEAFMMGLSQLGKAEPRDKPGIEQIEPKHMMEVRGRKISVNQLDARLEKVEVSLAKRSELTLRVLSAIGALALAVVSWLLGKFG